MSVIRRTGIENVIEHSGECRHQLHKELWRVLISKHQCCKQLSGFQGLLSCTQGVANGGQQRCSGLLGQRIQHHKASVLPAQSQPCCVNRKP